MAAHAGKVELYIDCLTMIRLLATAKQKWFYVFFVNSFYKTIAYIRLGGLRFVKLVARMHIYAKSIRRATFFLF